MSFYQVNLAVFAAGNVFLLLRQYLRARQRTQERQRHQPGDDAQLEDQPDHDGLLSSPSVSPALAAEARRFQLQFLAVYGLAVAADWLQVNIPSPHSSIPLHPHPHPIILSTSPCKHTRG